MTPATVMLSAMRGRHAMVSFANARQLDDAAEICQSVILDNGSYSSWQAGKQHDFAGYQAWATLWIKHPAVEWCVIPDVIDGDESVNDALLSDWSIDPSRSAPVFHMHESLERLERLVNTYPRIALGSSGRYARRWSVVASHG